MSIPRVYNTGATGNKIIRWAALTDYMDGLVKAACTGRRFPNNVQYSSGSAQRFSSSFQIHIGAPSWRKTGPTAEFAEISIGDFLGRSIVLIAIRTPLDCGERIGMHRQHVGRAPRLIVGPQHIGPEACPDARDAAQGKSVRLKEIHLGHVSTLLDWNSLHWWPEEPVSSVSPAVGLDEPVVAQYGTPEFRRRHSDC